MSGIINFIKENAVLQLRSVRLHAISPQTHLAKLTEVYITQMAAVVDRNAA